MSTRRRVWVSRGQNTLKKYSPPCQNHPVCPLDHACFVFGRSRRCNANFPHRNLLCVWTIVWGGRNMVPTGAWPILILRGVSQPTPNAPEVPRAIGVCNDVSNDIPFTVKSHLRCNPKGDPPTRCLDIGRIGLGVR